MNRLTETSIYDDLAKVVSRNTTKEALVYLEHSYSYIDLLSIIDKLADDLSSIHNVSAGDVLVCHVASGPTLLILCFVAAKLKCTFVPLDQSLKTEEFERFVNETICRPYIYFTDLQAQLHQHYCRKSMVVNFKGDILFHETHNLERDQGISNSMFVGGLVLQSSGSTGRPKGIFISSQAQRERIHILNRPELRECLERTLCALPLTHAHGLECLALPTLIMGGTLYLFPPQRANPITILNLIYEHQITFFSSIPAFYEVLVKHVPLTHATKLQSLKLAFCGSAFLSIEIAKLFHQKFGIFLRQGYGVTEICMICMHDLNNRDENFSGHVGRVLPGVDYRIVDDELQVKSQGLFSYYLPQVEQVDINKINSGGYYSTGDLVREDKDKNIYIMGRRDDLISIYSQKFYPWEVERLVIEHTKIKECALIQKGENLLSLVLLSESRGAEQKREVELGLEDIFKKYLSSYKHPQQFLWVEQFPKNPLGKILKNQLVT